MAWNHPNHATRTRENAAACPKPLHQKQGARAEDGLYERRSLVASKCTHGNDTKVCRNDSLSGPRQSARGSPQALMSGVEGAHSLSTSTSFPDLMQNCNSVLPD